MCLITVVFPVHGFFAVRKNISFSWVRLGYVRLGQLRSGQIRLGSVSFFFLRRTVLWRKILESFFHSGRIWWLWTRIFQWPLFVWELLHYCRSVGITITICMVIVRLRALLNHAYNMRHYIWQLHLVTAKHNWQFLLLVSGMRHCIRELRFVTVK